MVVTRTSLLVLCGLLIVGGRGTEGQLTPTTPAGISNDAMVTLYSALLESMFRNNEDLAALFAPTTQATPEKDDDYVTASANSGPTFAQQPPMDDDYYEQGGRHCTCTGGATQRVGPEPDDDYVTPAQTTGTENSVSNLMSLLGFFGA